MKIGIVANCSKPRAPEVLRRLDQKAGQLGLELFADEETASHLSGASVFDGDQVSSAIDALVAMGGDGTMLRTVRLLGDVDVPVMGVNIGSLGFLTSVSEDDLDRAMDCLVEKNYSTSTRSLIDCTTYRNGDRIGAYRALNDVVVGSGASVRVVSLDLAVEDEGVSSYMCDGLIVATPTGSTGHSLSTGGPILCPETGAFIISLICPHTLSSRPMVVPDSKSITIAVGEAHGELLLSVDGQVGDSLLDGDYIKVRRADRSVRFVHLPGYSYFAVLRQKLSWSGSSR